MSKPFTLVSGASSALGLELAAICAPEGFGPLVAADRPETQAGADRLRRLGANVAVSRVEPLRPVLVRRLHELADGDVLDDATNLLAFGAPFVSARKHYLHR
jgi:NAD(P)-dependent dehydrogenase (short-subunit alcohol dehydrogenase family)